MHTIKAFEIHYRELGKQALRLVVNYLFSVFFCYPARSRGGEPAPSTPFIGPAYNYSVNHVEPQLIFLHLCSNHYH